MKSIIVSLKRSSVFLFLLFFVLSSFAGEFIPTKLLIRTWSSFGVESGSVSSLNAPIFNVTSEDDIFSVLNTSTVGICLNTLRRDYNYGVVVPSFSTNVVFTTSYNYMSITNSVRGSIDGSTCLSSVGRFPRVQSLFQSTAALYWNGYSGPGFKDIFLDDNKICINVNYPLLYADVLSSTNTSFRQILISHISNINSSVINIDTGVSALVPSVDRIADINSSIFSNSFDVVSLLRNIDTNFSSVVSSVIDVNPRLDSVTNLLELLHHDSVTDNLDVLLGDDTSSWVGYANWACDNHYITDDELDYFVNEFQSTDPFNLFRSRSYSIPDSHRRFLAKSNLKGRVVAANKLRGMYLSLHAGQSPQPSNDPYWLESFFSDVGLHASTILRDQVQGWRESLRQQLQDWKTSDEHGILNVKNKLDDVDSAIKKNFEFNPPVGPDNPLGTNTIPYTAFVTNYVTRPLTNSIDEAADRIVTNEAAQAEATRDFLNDNLFNPEAPGAYVRIKFPLYPQDGPAVHVHDTALDVFGVGIDEINYNLARMLDNFDSRWETWFRLWGDWSSPVATNIEDILQVLLSWTNTTVQLDHVLFQDYSNYVFSASYDDLFSTLENDYPVCYSNLVKFGLSSSEDGGRWWNVLASSVSYDTAILSYVFNDMVELDRIARDSLGKSPFTFLRDTLSDMPSKSKIEDYVSQASNSTFQISYSLSSLSNSLNSVSNSFDSVFNPFRGHFDSPGSSVTFFKLYDGRDGRYVTIPVSDQADAWRYIRLGVSFGLVAVNILLFPKYLLMLFTLFVKAYRIGIEFFPDDR